MLWQVGHQSTFILVGSTTKILSITKKLFSFPKVSLKIFNDGKSFESIIMEKKSEKNCFEITPSNRTTIPSKCFAVGSQLFIRYYLIQTFMASSKKYFQCSDFNQVSFWTLFLLGVSLFNLTDFCFEVSALCSYFTHEFLVFAESLRTKSCNHAKFPILAYQVSGPRNQT